MLDDMAWVSFFPRIHTAIAEWLACILWSKPLLRRYSPKVDSVIKIVALLLLMITNLISQYVGGVLWMPMMLLGMLTMAGMIWASGRISLNGALYLWSYAFISAEFAASLEWQINYYLNQIGIVAGIEQSWICMLIVYTAGAILLYRFRLCSHKSTDESYISGWDTKGALLIALCVFALSNLSFAWTDTVFSRSLGAGSLYVRTLIDAGGLILLHAYRMHRKEIELRYELTTMQSLFDRQYAQYQQFEANNANLRRIYHDLKHQLAFIENETDAEKRSSYLSDIKRVLLDCESEIKTGCSVLDTLLTGKNQLCQQQCITLHCNADAKELSIMSPMDICSVFGNAVDNAMEYEARVPEASKRLITVDVHLQNQFIVIKIANYCEQQLSFVDGLPETTKNDKQMHGFGVKSIRLIAEKYNGHVKMTQEDNWFVVDLLIPASRS